MCVPLGSVDWLLDSNATRKRLLCYESEFCHSNLQHDFSPASIILLPSSNPGSLVERLVYCRQYDTVKFADRI